MATSRSTRGDGPLLGALGPRRQVDGSGHSLPFNLTGNPALLGGGDCQRVGVSQFLSGLLKAAPADGIDIQHIGEEIPSRPHVHMTLAMLRARGVDIDDTMPDRWIVSPGAIRPLDVTIEPDLSNAAPFLAAAAITGGTVTVPNWPSNTIQPGDAIREILQHFGAKATLEGGSLQVHGTNRIHGVDLDLSGAAELTPVVAAVAALADDTSHLRGIAHIRGHGPIDWLRLKQSWIGSSHVSCLTTG
jgi:3-phosphoshikimate 1-carboxyvinyltransferase